MSSVMAHPNFLSGQMLLALPGMGDPRFDHAVIMLCAHDEDGALGRRPGAPGAELGEEVELVRELRVRPGVGKVAAGGDVEVVDRRPGRKPAGDVAGVP